MHTSSHDFERCGSTGTVYGATWEIPQSPFPPPLDVRITNGNGDTVRDHLLLAAGCSEMPACLLPIDAPIQCAGRTSMDASCVQCGCRCLRAKQSRAAERLGSCQLLCSSPLQAWQHLAYLNHNIAGNTRAWWCCCTSLCVAPVVRLAKLRHT